MRGFIQGLLWRVYQIALLLMGVIIFFRIGGEDVVGSGMATVIASWTWGFFFSYFGTKITVSIIDRLTTKRPPDIRQVER